MILLKLELPFQAFALSIITAAAGCHSLHIATQFLDLGLVMFFDPFHNLLDSVFQLYLKGSYRFLQSSSLLTHFLFLSFRLSQLASELSNFSP